MEGQMVPTNLDVDDTMTAVECFRHCIHADACCSHLIRQHHWKVDGDYAYWHDTFSSNLGCKECDYFEEDESGGLRTACHQLIDVVRLGELECHHKLMPPRLKALLRILGFRTD